MLVAACDIKKEMYICKVYFPENNSILLNFQSRMDAEESGEPPTAALAAAADVIRYMKNAALFIFDETQPCKELDDVSYSFIWLPKPIFLVYYLWDNNISYVEVWSPWG